ncbi:hypothetical protein [Bacteroides sp.]|uniref:hypothetical protein n=1 Tax=Bacteroides sp. TaxID=29523 RepID=UPI00261621B0|nr:hypothetical protein [Bacteroides sp.]MDD3040444.1 hypothetical protein [Bacteroides sp.]
MSWKDDVLTKIKLQEEKNAAIVAAIPEKYRHYIQLMDRGTKISNKDLELDKDLLDVGCYVSTDKKTYLPLKSAYFTVMGKIAMLNDWAEQKGYDFVISSAKYTQIGTKWACEKQVTVFDPKGRIVKQASGTASVGFGGNGVDATSPLENAETSALGRALTYLGMGTQTENIASLDEMKEAARREIELGKTGETTEETTEGIKEKFRVDDLKDFTKDDAPIAKLTVVNTDTGDIQSVWLKNNQALQVKHLGLKNGDVIEAVLSEIPGKEGPVNTFLEFSKAS